MKKIVAFAASSSSTSINKQLVEFVLTYFPDYEVDLLDLNDYEMPLFSVDRARDTGFPELAYEFSNKMKNADIVICSFAEHNGSYTVAFKNILDWCSRIDVNVFGNKPMFLMSTSPGGFGGGNVMKVSSTFLPKHGAEIQQTFSLPSFNQNFLQGEIISGEFKVEIEGKIKKFRDFLVS